MINIINKLKQGVIDAEDEFKKYGYHSSIVLDFEEAKSILEVIQINEKEKPRRRTQKLRRKEEARPLEEEKQGNENTA